MAEHEVTVLSAADICVENFGIKGINYNILDMWSIILTIVIYNFENLPNYIKMYSRLNFLQINHRN